MPIAFDDPTKVTAARHTAVVEMPEVLRPPQ
jgi:hypothetical protein